MKNKELITTLKELADEIDDNGGSAAAAVRESADRLTALMAARVMLQVFDVSIATGVWPKPESLCHKNIREIISAADMPNEKS